MLQRLQTLSKKQKIIIYSSAAAIAAIAAIIVTVILVHTIKNPPAVLFNSNDANYITPSNFSNFETSSNVYIPEATITIVTDSKEQKIDKIFNTAESIKQTPQNTVVIKPESLDTSLLSKRQTRLNVNYVPQNPELPTGCEITALTTVLNFYGYNVSKTEMSDKYLEKTMDKLGNFWEEFVGDPRGKGFGCYAKPIINAANKYFATQENQHTAINYSGTQFEDLLRVVEDGTPVVIWATMYSQKNKTLCEAYASAKWNINGKELKWLANEHCMVLIGYDLDKNIAIVSDPQRGIVEYDLETLKARYVAMHSQSVVIKASAPIISGVENGKMYYSTQCVTVTSQNLESVLLNGVEQKNTFLIDGNVDNIYIIEATDTNKNTTVYTVYTKEIFSIMQPLDGINQNSVTVDNKTEINNVKNQVLEIDTTYASAQESIIIDEILKTCDNLLNRILEVDKKITEIVKLSDECLQEQYDQHSITMLLEDINAVIAEGNLTTEQRSKLNSISSKLKDLLPQYPQIDSSEPIME